MFAFRYMCQFVMWVLSKCIQCLLWLSVKNFSFLIRFIINCFQLVFLFKTVCTVQNVLLSTKALQLRLHSISCRLSWTIFLCVTMAILITLLEWTEFTCCRIILLILCILCNLAGGRWTQLGHIWFWADGRTDLMFTRWMKMK